MTPWPHLADDVRLIQVMLNTVINASNGLKLPPENGVYPDDLGVRIRKFQAAMNGSNAQRGKHFKEEDSIVHPMPGSRINWDTRFASGRMSTGVRLELSDARIEQ